MAYIRHDISARHTRRTLRMAAALIAAVMAFMHPVATAAQTAADMPDREQLQIALEYFSSGKYDEALTLLVRLDRKYRLNARFKAYIGLCYYHQWAYDKACAYIDPYIDELEVYAPHERSVYYFTSAESHFFLREYAKAVPMYERMLLVCYDKEKGDAFFRLAYCHMDAGQWTAAKEMLDSALAYYERFGYPENRQARVVQIEKMQEGCQTKIEEQKRKERNFHTR